MAERTFVCRRCRDLKAAETRMGPLPTVCDDCDPEAAERRRAKRVRMLANHHHRRQREQHLFARIAELEAALDFERRAVAVARGSGTEPGKAAVGRAVRRLAQATGRDGTANALLLLAGECRRWAFDLSRRVEDDADADG